MSSMGDDMVILDSAAPSNGKPKRHGDSLRSYFRDFCNRTRIHGFQYLGEQNRHWIERLWWLTLIFIHFGICLYFILQISGKWRSSPNIITSIDPYTPTWKIPFPAVTICPENKIKQSAYNFTKNFYQIYDDDYEMSQEEMDTFAKSSLVCHNHLYAEGNLTVGHDTIRHLINVAPQIEDVFVSCRWGSLLENCTQLFTPLMTNDGLCFTFNMLNIFSDSVYSETPLTDKRTNSAGWTLEHGYPDDAPINTNPKRALIPGPYGGLSLLIKTATNDLDYICRGGMQGFKIHFHHPSEVPQISNNYLHIPLNEEAIFTIKAEMTTNSDGLKVYDYQKRNCYFAEDRQLKFYRTYSQAKCQIECLSNYTLKRCNCVTFHLPHDNSSQICGPRKVECVYQARTEITQIELNNTISGQQSNCNCLASCTTLSYQTETSQNLYNWQKVYEVFQANYTKEIVHSRVMVYFKENHFTSLTRGELYSRGEILAYCGGLLAIFTGFSFLCLVEIVYFLTVRAFFNVRTYGAHKWSGGS